MAAISFDGNRTERYEPRRVQCTTLGVCNVNQIKQSWPIKQRPERMVVIRNSCSRERPMSISEASWWPRNRKLKKCSKKMVRYPLAGVRPTTLAPRLVSSSYHGISTDTSPQRAEATWRLKVFPEKGTVEAVVRLAINGTHLNENETWVRSECIEESFCVKNVRYLYFPKLPLVALTGWTWAENGNKSCYRKIQLSSGRPVRVVPTGTTPHAPFLFWCLFEVTLSL